MKACICASSVSFTVAVLVYGIVTYLFLLYYRGLSPLSRYRLPTPRNRLRGSYSDRFEIRARFARSLFYDSRDNITNKFEFGICIIVYHPFSPI